MTMFARTAGALAVALALAGGLGGTSARAQEAIVVDLVNEPSSLDPHKQWNPDSYYVYRNIFDQLLTRDDSGEIAPEIATGWEYESDSAIVFTIRDDVRFHDGAPLTAADVAFSVRRITDPAFASPQLGQFNSITGAEVIDDAQVRLTTDGPYPALLAQLVKLSIVPQHHVEAVGDDAFNLEPVGSGPYRFVEWQRGVSVSLARNDDYWGDPGSFELAEFRAVPDASTRVADLLSGTADIIVSINPDHALQIDGTPGVEARSVLTERVGYLKLNPQIAPTDDLRVRQAIAHAIDRQLLIDGLLGGFDAPVGIMLSPAHVGWVDGIEPLPYDPDHARALIEEVGAPARARMEFATSPAFDQRIVQALQQMLTSVGLDVEIVMTDMAAYLGRAQGPIDQQANMAFGRWSCACQDADGVLLPLLESTQGWSSYANPEADRLLHAARSTLDPEARLDAYEQVHRIVVEDVPLVPLYQAAILYGVNADLVWQPTPNESMFLNRMSWAD